MTPRLKTQLAEQPTQLSIPTGWGAQRWIQRGWILAAGFGLHLWLAKPTSFNPSPAHGLTEVLASTAHVSASPSDVYWVDDAPSWWMPWRTSRAWVLAAAPGQLDDVYLAFARRTPEGAVLSLQRYFNITDTRAVSEQHLVGSQTSAAWVTGSESELFRLQMADLAQSPLAQPEAAELSPTQRWQWRLTWLQQTGQLSGMSHRQFKLIPPAAWAKLEYVDAALQLTTPSGTTTIPAQGRATQGAEHVAEQTSGLARPGNVITWAVDRVRALPWFGDENMQRLKAVAYHAWDWSQRTLGVATDDGSPLLSAGSGTTPLGALGQQTLAVAPSSTGAGREGLVANPRAWPPTALEPVLSPAQPGEGQWVSLNDDPFIKPTLDPQGLFYTTFLRTDPERDFSQILITAWDPLTVELHMMSGTEEPKSATGETGTGLVPRTPGVVDNLVAAFNGGFQATHGDFGMMVDHALYVPPLPYAATVATDADGRVGFGTWPEDRSVPEQLTSFRQNLTPLVANGQFNPYHRSWWGGVPSGWEDDTRTVRSGLCLTQDGLLAYFYGAKVDPEHLANAMLAMHCSYGLHLDMNQGHTGLEFYRVGKDDELPPLALTLDSMWQAEGPVSDSNGLRFRGRRMFRSMQLMNFPRFIGRETRDFFYLTARPLLPRGAAVGDAHAGDLPAWQVPKSVRESTSGPAFPYPLATTHRQPVATRPGTRVNLLELDPRLLTPEPHANPAPNGATSMQPTEPDVLVTFPAPAASSSVTNLWWYGGHAQIAATPPDAQATLLASGVAAEAAVQAGFGVSAATGNIVYAEIATSPDPALDRALLAAELEREGCPLPHVYAADASRIAIGDRDLNGHPAEQTGPRLAFRRRVPERTFALFPETPVVPFSVWKPLQASH